MVAFFKFVSNNVASVVNDLLPYRINQEKQPSFLQQRIRARFDHLVRDRYWQAISSLMHFSPDVFFDRIYAELVFLAQKKDVNEISLLDLIFLSEDQSVIRTFITRNSIPCTRVTLNKAIQCNSVKGLEFLAQQGVLLAINDLDFAASNGRLACVQYLIGRGVQPDNGTLDQCVMLSGHVPTIRYLVEVCGIDPTESNVDSSIIGGQHLANRYLRERLRHAEGMLINTMAVIKG